YICENLSLVKNVITYQEFGSLPPIKSAFLLKFGAKCEIGAQSGKLPPNCGPIPLISNFQIS
ncbi:MAG: hypothetical protein MK160_16220, partial [Rhodobacteraceae bacterium]|nr:hypothetical protein [Paracoccaceae bacterium]